MRASELKKKYATIWARVETQVIDDSAYFIGAIEDFDYVRNRVAMVAHNAAFVACAEHHKAITARKRKRNEKETRRRKTKNKD